MAIYEGTSLVLKGEKWELGVTNEKFRPTLRLLNQCTFYS